MRKLMFAAAVAAVCVTGPVFAKNDKKPAPAPAPAPSPTPTPAASNVTVGKVTLIAANCAGVASATGCLFDGNIAPNTVADTQAAYNIFNDRAPVGGDIRLNYLFKSDDGNKFLGTITGNGTAQGTWSTPGHRIDFIGVKASNSFVLYRLVNSATSGTWSTADIPFNRNPHAVSHVTFFGQPVPEPATWAMMIGGFGLIGAALRRRQRMGVLLAA